MKPTKTIRVKDTGVVTVVPLEYFEKYVNEGWFIEVIDEVKATPKKVAAPKEV